MTQSQKEFEAWYVKSHWPNVDNCLARQVAWSAWQASRHAVTVDLPTLIIDEYDNGDTLEYVEVSELKEALDKAGITYK